MSNTRMAKPALFRALALFLALILLTAGFVGALASCGKSNPESTPGESSADDPPGSTPTTSDPVTTSDPPGFEDSPESGVWVEYYNGTALDRFVTAERSASVGGVWESGLSPADGVNADYYSILYCGRILAPITGEVTFTSAADDGVLFRVNGKTLIRDAGPHLTERHSGKLSMTEGELYEFTLEYYNGELGGDLSLSWSYGGRENEEIAEEYLFLPRYPVRTVFSYTEDKETVTACMASDSDGDYTLVIERLGEGGEVLEKTETKRPRGAVRWEADMTTNDKTRAFAAYVTDGEGNTVSQISSRQHGEDIRLSVDAEKKTGAVSELLYGVCMEDVNHELYGGIWAQMIFGEAFEEESSASSAAGFTSAGGSWKVNEVGGERILSVEKTANGPKLLADATVSTTGSFSADVYVDGEGAGFLLKTSNATAGADSFDGYEVSLFENMVRVAKHMHNYTNLKDSACSAPLRSWINLRVDVTEDSLTVYVDGERIWSYTDPSPIPSGAFGFRAWNASAQYKNIRVRLGSGEERELELPDFTDDLETAGMWKAERKGSVEGNTAVITEGVYSGRQSQRLAFYAGEGSLSISNMGLNRMGMRLEGGKEYNGYFYAKSEGVTVTLAFENADGSVRYAETEVRVEGDYKKYDFTLTPRTSDAKGRFVLELKRPGVLDVGYVYLQPGEWGLYKGLPVRRDVGELLEKQGITVLRFGGCMVNASGYRWKKMTGAPETRESYAGWWYPYSSFGFGIVEFLDLCEALGVEAIPDFSSYETPADMQDFVRFALGTDPEDPWVALRRSMGREEPYSLHYIQIGNEEKVDIAYANRFNRIADAIWEIDDTLTLVVGDFDYKEVITDPYRFSGAASGITSLAAHKRILDNAASHNRPVFFDIHFWSESGSDPMKFIPAAISFYEALKTVSPEADTALCVFELNANAHDLERALCNAIAIGYAERLSDILKIVCSANALQVDRQNDNGWDQGLVFMDNSGAWYQPPAYVDRMYRDVWLPYTAAYGASEDVNGDRLDITVTVSEDGRTAAVKIVNRTGKALGIGIEIPAFSAGASARAVTLSGGLKDKNTTDRKEALVPVDSAISGGAFADGVGLVTVDGYSVTTVLVTAK